MRLASVHCKVASYVSTTQSIEANASAKTVEIHIKRRANPDAPQYWEQFEIPYRPNLNVISCLMEIQKNPVTKDGQADHAARLGHELSRTGVRHLHDGHQRTRAAVVLGADRQSRSADQARADVEVSERSRSGR